MRPDKIALGVLILVLAIWIGFILQAGYDQCFKRWLGIDMGFIEDEMSIGCNYLSMVSAIGIMVSIVGVSAVFGPWFIWKGLRESAKRVS